MLRIDATAWPLADAGRPGTVPVNGAGPVGSVDSATSPAHRTVELKGWASDPNAPASPVEIHVYIGGDVGTPGVELHKFMADLPRAGGGRGFSRTLVTSKGDAQTINVYALNVPGTPGANRLIKSFALTVYVDTTPPETTITSAPATATTADVIRVTFTANESNSTFECRWDQDAWLPCQSGTQVSLTPGKHQVSVRATDKYGNTELTPAVFLVTVTAGRTTASHPGRAVRAHHRGACGEEEVEAAHRRRPGLCDEQLPRRDQAQGGQEVAHRRPRAHARQA